MIERDNNATDTTYLEDADTKIVVRGILFDVPLYGYYCFVIDKFQPGEIAGTLLTCPIEIEGPFETREQAVKFGRSVMNSSPENSQHS